MSLCLFVAADLLLLSHTHTVSADHEVRPDAAARYRGSLNEDSASSNWSSPYAERNVSHSVAYTSTGKGRTQYNVVTVNVSHCCLDRF